MRIIPYELYTYAPDISLRALRKEFGMYDYCLNKKIKNKGMQPFLELGRNYFNLSFHKWILEMSQRKHYVNSFHNFYAKNNKYEVFPTNFCLILECCIQWEIKQFLPYNISLSWFQISKYLLSMKHNNYLNYYLSEDIYKYLIKWYCSSFIHKNNKGLLKPKNLHMNKIILFFSNNLIK